MPSLTVEKYLKAALQISMKSGSEWVSTGELAAAMHVSPGTVTSMLKTLAESELATYRPYEGASLTPAGRKLAMRMLRRHRLIELFLVQTLDLTWDRVHEEAENMEHAVSDLLIDRIDAYLGYPAADPHGDPIPKADGTVAGTPGRRLSDLAVGERFCVARVIEQSSDFLRYLTEAGLQLGAEGTVVANRAEAGVITIQCAGQQTTLAHDVAGRLLVK